LPITGDPEMIRTETPGRSLTSALAIARERRRCPRPKVSWL
jgi:hypothetical protein